MKKSLRRMERKHGPGKAKSIFAHELGRTMHAMPRHKTVFDVEKFPRG
ncbi:MAG: hypothetical protein ACQESR_00080 [Planctomycetota bacterium]